MYFRPFCLYRSHVSPFEVSPFHLGTWAERMLFSGGDSLEGKRDDFTWDWDGNDDLF